MQGRVSDVTRLRQRLAEAKREHHDRKQELQTIRERIEQLSGHRSDYLNSGRFSSPAFQARVGARKTFAIWSGT